MKRIPPGLALLFIAPVLGELVSGHQKPLDFFNPLVFVILALPYGFGALICRELLVRWGKGRLGLILLAIAYGFYEEAIVVRSFFNPDWLELEKLAGYGHALGVNWTYAQVLVHFHVLISIFASILLAELLYPEQRHRPWLNNWGLAGCIIGLLLWWPAGFMMTSYPAPLLHYAISILVIVALILLVRFLPIENLQPVGGSPARPWWFFALGLVNVTLVFVAVFFTPELEAPPPLAVTFAFVVLVNVVSLWLFIAWSRKGPGWNDMHRLAWLAGSLGFFLVFNVMGDWEDGFQGKIFVSLAMVAFLWWVRGVILKRQLVADNPTCS
jgi:uncharacterized membrane protein YdcZ (DUF606 family)